MMSATELLAQMVGVNVKKFSKDEVFIIEAEYFSRIQAGLKEYFKDVYKDFFQVMKFNTEMESAMIEANFLRYVINDILLSEEYSLQGIAYYTQVPEDAISDVFVGTNTSPSLQLSQRIIDLHRSIRPCLYKEIMKKATAEYEI
jgi:hypothetical protein